MSNNTHSRQELPDTRSKLDPPKPTSNSTDLDASDAVIASSTDGRDHSESTGQALVTSSNLATAKLLSRIEGLIYPNVMATNPNGASLDLLLALKNMEGSLQEVLSHLRDAANQQHLSSEGIQVQTTTQAIEEDVGPKGGLSRTKANNLYTTFAFLVEAYAKSSRKMVNEKPNVIQIAISLEKLAADVNQGQELDSQRHGAIKKSIVEAMKVKKSKLPQKVNK